MNVRTAVVTLVGLGCVGAAGIGAYLGVRSGSATSAAPTVQPARQAPAADASTPATPETSSLPPAQEPAQPAPAVEARPKAPERTRTTALRSADPAAPAPVALSAQSAPDPRPAELPVAASSEVPAVKPADDVATAAPDAPQPPVMDERTVDAASVIGIRLDTSISSETARVEDRVAARVTRDVTVEGRTVIPAGARLDGFVTVVERGGKMHDRARIGIRFDSLVIGDDGTMKVPIQTETIFRDGESPSNEASSRIGASAVVGTILGAVLGGRKGAAIGATAGAASGSAAVMAGDRNAAVMTAGTMLTVRLKAPVSIFVPHEN